MNSEKRLLGFLLYPAFKLDEPRFPQDTFLGRWLHFNDVIDPRTLFVSKEKLNETIQLLEDYRTDKLKGPLDPAINELLWRAQKIKQATFHRDTGEKIFMPFRMAGFVPFGSPIVLGLLLPNPSLGQTIFWQWLNQSHNACVNYANRNATKPTPASRFAQGYLGAVTTAVSVAAGLSILLKKSSSFKPATKMFVQRFIPFPAVAFASTCNVLLMRWHETKQGIEVFDSKGNIVGTSKIAAKQALRDTAVTRAFLPAPIFLIPPIIMSCLEKTKFLQLRPKFHLPFNGLTCTLSFAFALPVAIALFPQISKISAHRLEPSIAQATKDEFLLYNKGL